MFGMDVTYDKCIYHGEEVGVLPHDMSSPAIEPIIEGTDEIFNMMDDIFYREDVVQEIREDEDTTIEEGDRLDGDSSNDERRVDMDNYERLLSEAQRELYPSCK